MMKFSRITISFLTAGIFLGLVYFVIIVPQNEVSAQSSNVDSSIVVNSLEDELNSDGDCSLREAIEAANENNDVDACPAGSDVLTDTIYFSVLGEITVTSQLSVTAGGPLLIDGGDVITTSGGGTTRVWWVESGSLLRLDHLAIVRGLSNQGIHNQGGGIYNNSGNVTIVDGTFSLNQAVEAGAIYNLGTMEIIDSVFSNNNGIAVDGAIRNRGTLSIINTNFTENSSVYSGGAVGSWGTLSVIDSTFISNTVSMGPAGGLGGSGAITIIRSIFVGNVASAGGGVVAGDGTTIVDSTFMGNVADVGGGIAGGYDGEGNITIINSTISGNSASLGGGYYSNGITTIINSTISGNSASTSGGGIYAAYTGFTPSTLNLSYSTIADNNAPAGGGIYNRGNTTLSTSIIADNPSGGDCLINMGYITDSGHNLDSDDTCGLDPANGSLPHTKPMLGSLQDNGGATLTHALQPGSPAIDAGTNNQCPPSDQRGMFRPIDGDQDGNALCDIGSYEAGGAYLSVNTLENELNNDGDCSLREAVEAANTNTAVDQCVSGNELFDMINFDVMGTITLNSQLTVMSSGELMINGADSISISGAGATRIMSVQPGSKLALSHLAILDGFTSGNGAGIDNSGELTIGSSTIAGSDGALGGGIYNSASLRITDSTLFGNGATSGGGISNWGTLVITNSTFSGNQADDTAGGIDNQGTLTMFNGTVAENSAVNGPGGGISSSGPGSTTLVNSIVAENLGGDCTGVITDGGHNLSSDQTCSFDPALGSLFDTDPLLGPLQDNGGSTQTHALLTNSPAIDAGNNEECTSSDQRGSFRPLDGNGDRIVTCDIGSFEADTGYLLVNTPMDESETNGNCSLREALQAANTNLPVDGCGQGEVFTDTIIFAAEGTITVSNQLVVHEGGPLIVDGNSEITISGGGTTSILLADPGSDLNLQSLVIQDGQNSGDYAAGLSNDHGKVAIVNSTFTHNITTDWSGGAIDNQGVLSISNSTFYSNTVWWSSGGGINNSSEGILTIMNSTFSDNRAYSGGGIYNGGVLTITNSTLSGNSSYWHGGGLNNSGTVSIINSTISSNSIGQGEGGGVSSGGSILIINSTITANSAPLGGGIGNTSTISLGDSIIANNDGGDCHPAMIDLGHNLDSDGTCGLNSDIGSLPNTDPLIGPLQDNGGPTWTHALLEGSPAIDAGDNALCPLTDQRGVTRPLDGNHDGIAVCDIGAFEYGSVPTFVFLPIINRQP